MKHCRKLFLAAVLVAAAPAVAAAETALPLAGFGDGIGVNTHIDFRKFGYQDRGTVARSLAYLGIRRLRDSPGSDADRQWWAEIARATGAKFMAYIGEVSPAEMPVQLNRMKALARDGLLIAMEGGNEEDDLYPRSLGNTLAATAAFQHRVYEAAHAAGLPAVNMSFGQGWTPLNHWHGNYDKVGDLSAVADYANAHTYPDHLPGEKIRLLNDNAHLAASSRPVMITEIGWDTAKVDSVAAAKYSLDAVFDAVREKAAGMYFYALYDDQSGRFGLMNADGTPKPAGRALHNLARIMQDSGKPRRDALAHRLQGMPSSAHSLLYERSDGTFFLVLWNEVRPTAATVPVTLHLDRAATAIRVMDPMTGTEPVQTGAGHEMRISLPDHPVVVEISQ